MRLVSTGTRVRRAAEPSEPEPEGGPEPTHHAHPEHHSDLPEHHLEHHHPGHDYKHLKDKFLNEITHLPSKSALRCFQMLPRCCTLKEVLR